MNADLNTKTKKAVPESTEEKPDPKSDVLVLPDGIPPYEARRFVSFECASRWQVLPVDYNDKNDELTIAVHDDSQIERLRRLHEFFLQSHNLKFQKVPREKIESVFRKDFSNPEKAARRWGLRPVLSSTAREKGAIAAAQRKWAANRRKQPHGRRAVDNRYHYTAMSRGLISAVALVVMRELAAETVRLDEARARVRYSQLLAARLQVSVTQMDSVVLAAWLSGLDDPVPVLSGIETPYPLQDILSQTKLGAKPNRIEARILNLVNAYQEIKRQDPAISANITLTRRYLKQRSIVSAPNEHMLELFLQILMDEDFLTQLDRACGRILIVDPAETVESLLSPPLISDGYEVEVVSGARAAIEKLEHFGADIVVAATTLADGKGVALCRRLKQSSRRTNTPVVLLAPGRDDKLQADALRAGADDFMVKPINLEVLFLKIQKLLAAAPVPETGPGVKGRLRDMSFSDLIQILSAGGKKMEIVLSGKAGRAKVLLDGANVVHAESSQDTGPEAFYSLMAWPDGDFTAQQCTEVEQPTMCASVMSLLMEGARRCDEGDS